MKINTTTVLVGGAGLYLVWRLWKRGTIGQLVNGTGADPADGNGTVAVNSASAGFDVFLV